MTAFSDLLSTRATVQAPAAYDAVSMLKRTGATAGAKQTAGYGDYARVTGLDAWLRLADADAS